jgi:hypothetical protein
LEYDANGAKATKLVDFVHTLPFVREIRDEIRERRTARQLKRERTKEYLRPMTMEEYRAKIARAKEDYLAGRSITTEELRKKIATWK